MFLVVTIAASQRRDLSWFKRQFPKGSRVSITDIISGLSTLVLMGPKTRELMARLSPDDFSNDAFPFGGSREIDFGYARVRATRVTFVGELGYEIYIESEFAAHVYDEVISAGAELGLKPGGFFALNSLRMEKGYRHWGHGHRRRGHTRWHWTRGVALLVAMRCCGRKQGADPATVDTGEADEYGHADALSSRANRARRAYYRFSHLRRLQLSDWSFARPRLRQQRAWRGQGVVVVRAMGG